MQVSKRSQYALEAVLYLALHMHTEHENIKAIAEKLGTSWKYLEQIFIILKRNGIVDSIRGAQGGYRLAKKPEEITAGGIIRALEGPLAPVPCVIEGPGRKLCERYEGCATRGLWEKIMHEINRTADLVSISDMAASYRKTEYEESGNFLI